MTTSTRKLAKGKNVFSDFRFDTFLIEAASRIGIIGTIVISCIYVFFRWGTQKQKEEFVDNFILLKILKNDEHYLYFTVLCVVIFYCITIFYFKNRLKLKEQRIIDLREDLDRCEKNRKK